MLGCCCLAAGPGLYVALGSIQQQLPSASLLINLWYTEACKTASHFCPSHGINNLSQSKESEHRKVMSMCVEVGTGWRAFSLGEFSDSPRPKLLLLLLLQWYACMPLEQRLVPLSEIFAVAYLSVVLMLCSTSICKQIPVSCRPLYEELHILRGHASSIFLCHKPTTIS